MPYNDLRFFTNEPQRDLYSRFNTILQNNTQYFDILVGYFRTSGFYMLYPAMQDIDKIRVLVGLNTDAKTTEIIRRSHKEAKDDYAEGVEKEFSESDDLSDVEQGVKLFVEWLRSGKVEMRMYPESPLHAKIYIMRKNLEISSEHFGSVITGSSNFSAAGLQNNLEFNVELKDSGDVEFALEKFNELWERSVDISEVYTQTVEEKTWLRDDITPYELYLKTIYEFFEEEINLDQQAALDELSPPGYMKLKYQFDAVIEAEKKLESHNGVFISDVVGLGKTYICAMLAKKLKRGMKLFICPPVLVDYWEKVLYEFGVDGKVESLGKLDKLIENGTENYEYVFIDEAHRFRNDKTLSFDMLHNICKGKKVILISATPINNYSSDIASQLYLFQSKRNSTVIPGTKNLEGFFRELQGKLGKFEKGTPEYLQQLRINSEEIRAKVLRNIMVRRTRRDIVDFYSDDMEQQGLTFPKLGTPEQVVYSFDDETDEVFTHTIQTIKALNYSRYSPITYLINPTSEQKKQMTAQTNLKGFMKSILVKRLESSFFAFKNTLRRFSESYAQFIDMCNTGDVYISKQVNVYDLLDSGDDDKLLELVEKDKVQKFKFSDFKDEFMSALKKDYEMLKRLGAAWAEINADPKLDEFKHELQNNPILKDNKLIIFTESKETAMYLGENLTEIYGDNVIVYSGESSDRLKRDIEYSYDPKYADDGEDKYRILITTDVLAEGVNLHRSGVLINYDLPWNPTRIMQRVGRINRVGTVFDRIYVFNFFPTAQTNMHLPLKERIAEKLQAFHDTLGEDFKYLTDDEEVTSHKLYDDLNANMDSDEVGNPELRYLAEIRRIRDEDIDLFEKIKKLPRKAKAGKLSSLINDTATVTFLRKGYLKAFFKTENRKTLGVSFLDAIRLIQATPDDESVAIGTDFFNHLNNNKTAFDAEVTEEIVDFEKATVTGNDRKVINLLKALSRCRRLTTQQEETLKKMINLWQNGDIPANTTKDILKLPVPPEIDELRLYAEIYERIPERYFSNQNQAEVTDTGAKEIILSCWLKGEENN